MPRKKTNPSAAISPLPAQSSLIRLLAAFQQQQESATEGQPVTAMSKVVRQLKNLSKSSEVSRDIRDSIADAASQLVEIQSQGSSPKHGKSATPELARIVWNTVERTLPSRYPAATKKDIIDAYHESYRYQLLKDAVHGKGNITLAQIADLVDELHLGLDELFNHPPAPWDTWVPGQLIYICIGSRAAKTDVTGREYQMVQRDDARAAAMLYQHFLKMRMGCRPQIYECEIEPPVKQDKKEALLKRAKEKFDQLLANSGGMVIVGSEHANALFLPAAEWVGGENDYCFDWKKQQLTTGETSWSRLERENGKSTDAGLVRIRRRSVNNSVRVVCLAAGLGPAGTLAAAQALTASHEISADLGDDGFYERGVEVTDSDRLLSGNLPTPQRVLWRWIG